MLREDRMQKCCVRAAVRLGVPEAAGTLRVMQRGCRRRGTCVGSSSRLIVSKEDAERQRGRDTQEGDALLKEDKKEGQGIEKSVRWGCGKSYREWKIACHSLETGSHLLSVVRWDLAR